MATAIQPRMPVEFSDDLARALYRETARQTPAEQRVSCPIHLDWRDHCRHLHEVVR
ncbi:hypothetical protein [Streptomyces hygroscopicus]|uniref:hypothetical protein n=1 Tax=Streptomyces hygroscopicus TaxID=1912 RepID=UPI00223ED3A8|nr:hypothetical protein [Streptomyces hygroscopicus]